MLISTRNTSINKVGPIKIKKVLRHVFKILIKVERNIRR
jgi:hypothetical protein